MVHADILLLVTVFGGLYALCDTVAADGNKEHVHIKVHVPELIKKHTHVRTIYKHHYKTKPIKHSSKSKTRYHKTSSPPSFHHSYYDRQSFDGQDRRDPAVRSGTGKYQQYQWIDHLVPAASHVHAQHSSAAEASGSVSEADVLTRWQQNFEKLNRQQAAAAKPKTKQSKKRRPVVPTPLPSVPSYYSHEDETTEPSPHTLDFGFFDSYAGDRHRFFEEPSEFRPSALHFTATRSEPKQNRETASPSFLEAGGPSNHASKHRSTVPLSSHQTDFKPPRLLKITEEDIRPSKGRSTSQLPRPSSRNNQKNTSSNKSVGTTKQRSTMRLKNTNKDVGLPPLIASPSWDGYATDKPFPAYIHAVAEALQYKRPYDAETADNYDPQSYGALGPTAMAMVHQMKPPQPISQEEFMPFRSSAQISFTKGTPSEAFNMETMPNIDSVEDVDENGEQMNINEDDGLEQDNDSSEFGPPASFDEVPYQTFTKRKNLLRNSHRE